MKRKAVPHPFEVTAALGGGWIVLCAGIQWGQGPFDRSGCSSQVFATYADAVNAIAACVEKGRQNVREAL